MKTWSFGAILASAGLAPLAADATLLTDGRFDFSDGTSDYQVVAEEWFGIDLSQPNPDFGTLPASLWLSDVNSNGFTQSFVAQLTANGALTVTESSRDGFHRSGTTTLVGDGRPVAVPEPGTLTLLGSGLLALGLISRRRKRTA